MMMGGVIEWWHKICIFIVGLLFSKTSFGDG